jgi:hypothetical protein
MALAAKSIGNEDGNSARRMRITPSIRLAIGSVF